MRAHRVLIMSVTVRLAPLLKTDVAVVQFPNVRNATAAVKDILDKGIGIRACGSCSCRFLAEPIGDGTQNVSNSLMTS